MNLPSLASLLATLLGLGLSVWLFVTNGSAQKLQRDLQTQQQALQNQQQLVQTQQQALQAQQEQINSGNALAQQIGPQVLNDLAKRAVANDNQRIRGLLAAHGLTIQDKPEGDKKPGEKKPATP